MSKINSIHEITALASDGTLWRLEESEGEGSNRQWLLRGREELGLVL